MANHPREADLNLVLYTGQSEGLFEAYERIEKELIPLLDEAGQAIVSQWLWQWNSTPMKIRSAEERWHWYECPNCGNRWHETWGDLFPDPFKPFPYYPDGTDDVQCDCREGQTMVFVPNQQ